ncbi:MAG: hypothetical protein F2663_06555 [Actinobacteria bacterium]|uniref:DNA-(apurinic or apyrimidinic site) lyase n=1 Tax=freshwater metagenome TaxID=449393 RepID=A0A6J6PQC2_9ZZZZ|nr:hypothetical protein [Actinomycetota bacterium]
MPEGDTLHRAANALQPLVGQQIHAISIHPRAQATRVAETVDGHTLESVTAFGKNLILRFSGSITVRSHLRMSGSWRLRRRTDEITGRPWLVLRASEWEGVLNGGPVLELHTRALARLGPDILATPPDIDKMLTRLRAADQTRTLGETLQDQELVAGIGNMWMAETLWHTQTSPWRRLRDIDEATRRLVLQAAADRMRAAVDSGREPQKQAHARAGRPCTRCGTPIRSWGQGDANRIAYWCPTCQPGPEPSVPAHAG